MPGISISGSDSRTVRHPSVSTEIFGKRNGLATEVTLVITRDGGVQMMEHDLLVEYARECLMDSRMALVDYADQVLAPHPAKEGKYVEVELAFDHDGNTSKLILFVGRERLYEWAI